MKKENIIKLIERLSEIEDVDFTMFHSDPKLSDETHDSVCSIIGYGSSLATIEDSKKFRYHNKNFKFIEWASNFLGVEIDSKIWDFIFHRDWCKFDDTVIFSIQRLQFCTIDENLQKINNTKNLKEMYDLLNC